MRVGMGIVNRCQRNVGLRPRLTDYGRPLITVRLRLEVHTAVVEMHAMASPSISLSLHLASCGATIASAPSSGGLMFSHHPPTTLPLAVVVAAAQWGLRPGPNPIKMGR
jgi:hypothetical protein